MNHKSLDTLVDDIYKAISPLSKGKPIKLSKKDLKEFGNDMTLALESWASPIERDTTKELPPSLFIKFLYGHLLEVLLLFFVKLSKHKVESLQKEVSVSGIKGHMDCKIDGEVVDIKSASGFAFKKFKDGTLAESDAFGYLSQLAGYEAAEKTNDGGFLVINKETGELTFFKPEDLDKPNIKNRIREVKRIVKRKTPPDFCYPTIPEGKSGNMKLPRECTYCPYKYECHKSSNDGKGLRVFNYAKGPTYFTKIINEPKVEEIL